MIPFPRLVARIEAATSGYLSQTGGLQPRAQRRAIPDGPQPVSKHPGCTAFLYRDDNVLGL